MSTLALDAEYNATEMNKELLHSTYFHFYTYLLVNFLENS